MNTIKLEIAETTETVSQIRERGEKRAAERREAQMAKFREIKAGLATK